MISSCVDDLRTNFYDNGFIKFFGNSYIDDGIDIIPVDDGFFILGTGQQASEQTDILLIKTDTDGNQFFEAKPCNVDSVNETATGFVLTNNQSLVIVGTFVFDNDSTEIYLLQTDLSGNILWKNTDDIQRQTWNAFFNDNANQKAASISRTADGGFIIAATTDSENIGNKNPTGKTDILIIRTDAQGQIQWHSSHGGPNNDVAAQVKELTNGDFIIVGHTETFNEEGQSKTNAIVIRTNKFGAPINKLTYGGSDDDVGTSIEMLPDGSFIMIGYSKTNSSKGNDIYLVKLGQTLQDIKWEQRIGGAGDDLGVKLCVTKDNDLLILGSTTGLGQGGSDIFLVKTDSEGKVIWQKSYGNTDNEYGRSLCLLNTGDIAIVGTAVFEKNSMLVLMKIDENGNFIK